MKVSTASKVVSVILKIIVIIAAVVGIVMSAAAGRETFMGGSSVFMFFTIQSNIAIALICLVGGIWLLTDRPIPHAWFVIKYMGTISITLTGAVFTFALAPTLGPQAWNMQNILTHVVVPVLSIIDFFVTGVYGDLRKRDVFFVLLPPLAYVIYAGIGYLAGWQFLPGKNYPYFFMDWGSPAGAFGFSKELPLVGTGWWIIGLLILLLLVGLLYLGIIHLLKKTRKKQEG